MKHYPRGGLLGKLRHAARDISALSLPVHAANTAYFLILSAFPILVLVMSLLRYTELTPHNLVALVGDFVPEAFLPEAEYLVLTTYQSITAPMVGLSAITALWSASRGIYGLLTGLNAVYQVEENRGYFYTRGISVLYTFLFLFVILLTLVLHVFGTGFLEFLKTSASPFWRFLSGLVDLRFFLLVFLQTALFTAMFIALPNHKNAISDNLPGAFLACIGWMIFSHLFSVYVEHFPRYANIFGSVYAVALCMLWLYFCILILFYGGLLNRFLSERPEN